MSAGDVQDVDTIEDVDFGTTLVNELLLAFQSCAINVDRREFKECRTEMLSEALMYSRHIHPTCLDIVDRVRAIMDRFCEMERVEQFIEDSKTLLEDCGECRGKVNVMVGQHAIVLGSLVRLRRKMQKEQVHMEESAGKILSSAKKHLAEAKLLRGLEFATIFIPPVAHRIHNEAEIKNETGKSQHNDALMLESAAKSFETLLTCHNILYKVIQVLATALNGMMTDMQSVLSAGKTARSLSKTAERGFTGLKRSAGKVVRHCDTFLNTRIEYPATMIAIGAGQLLTPDFERKWKDRLKIMNN